MFLMTKKCCFCDLAVWFCHKGGNIITSLPIIKCRILKIKLLTLPAVGSAKGVEDRHGGVETDGMSYSFPKLEKIKVIVEEILMVHFVFKTSL